MEEREESKIDTEAEEGTAGGEEKIRSWERRERAVINSLE